MTNIIISGINGRMGRAIEALCKNSDKFTVVGGTDAILGVPHKFPTAQNIF